MSKKNCLTIKRQTLIDELSKLLETKEIISIQVSRYGDSVIIQLTKNLLDKNLVYVDKDNEHEPLTNYYLLLFAYNYDILKIV